MPPPQIHHTISHILFHPTRRTSCLLLRQCPLTTSVLTRSYASPSPRAKKLSEAGEKVESRPPLTTAQIFERYNTTTFPMDTFMSAYKSKAIPFVPLIALNIVRRYAELRGDISPEFKAKVAHGQVLCEEFKIHPHNLAQLGVILQRSTQAISPYRPTAVHLITLAHELGDPSATIALYHRINKSPLPPGQGSRAAARQAMVRTFLNRIEQLAKTAGDPACAFVYGDYLSNLAGLNTLIKEEAKGWLRAAGEKGVGEAWLRLGQMAMEDAITAEGRWVKKKVEYELKATIIDKDSKATEKTVKVRVGGDNGKQSGNRTPPIKSSEPTTTNPVALHPEKVTKLLQEAEFAFEKACEADFPDAHFHLAQLIAAPPSAPPSTPPTPKSPNDDNESDIPDPHPSTPPIPPPPPPGRAEKYIFHLTKAAASGNLQAVYSLGMYYLHNHKPLTEKQLPEVRLLGREWITVAAYGGYADAMKVLAGLFKEEGKEALAKEWQEAAEWNAVAGAINHEMKGF